MNRIWYDTRMILRHRPPHACVWCCESTDGWLSTVSPSSLLEMARLQLECWLPIINVEDPLSFAHEYDLVRPSLRFPNEEMYRKRHEQVQRRGILRVVTTYQLWVISSSDSRSYSNRSSWENVDILDCNDSDYHSISNHCLTITSYIQEKGWWSQTGEN